MESALRLTSMGLVIVIADSVRTPQLRNQLEATTHRFVCVQTPNAAAIAILDRPHTPTCIVLATPTVQGAVDSLGLLGGLHKGLFFVFEIAEPLVRGDVEKLEEAMAAHLADGVVSPPGKVAECLSTAWTHWRLQPAWGTSQLPFGLQSA